MAITNRKSTYITNATASPKVASNPILKGGMLREACGTITPATDDSATSVFRFCRVPSNARISSVLLTAADFTTGGAIDIGVYDTEDNNSGAVVDADLFASALAMTGGPFSHAEQINESGEYTVAEQEKPLWEVLGLSADPHKEYDIAATITTDFNGGQAMHLKVRYVA